ncbi:MAG: hypothetical protein M3O07_10645 [Pseudomonadota bacterium]|nr:hypothetical protein [Pseudomonadota bacterium]
MFGAKHPRVLGLPVYESWRELWVAGFKELIEGVLRTGEAYWTSDRRAQFVKQCLQIHEGKIEVGLRQQGTLAQPIVRDTGTGIAQDGARPIVWRDRNGCPAGNPVPVRRRRRRMCNPTASLLNRRLRPYRTNLNTEP